MNPIADDSCIEKTISYNHSTSYTIVSMLTKDKDIDSYIINFEINGTNFANANLYRQEDSISIYYGNSNSFKLNFE